MKSLRFLGLISLCLISLFINSCDNDNERQITEKEVPQEILHAFTISYPNAVVNEYSEETEDGQKFYEISFENEGRKFDIVYKADGKISAIEETILVEELPTVISEAISKEFQQFSLKQVEKIETDGKTFFEVELVNIKNSKKYELLFSDIGKLIEKESTNDDDD